MSGLGTAIAMIRSLNNNAKLSTKKRHPNVFELKSRMEGVSSQHNYPTVSEQKRMELVEALLAKRRRYIRRNTWIILGTIAACIGLIVFL